MLQAYKNQMAHKNKFSSTIKWSSYQNELHFVIDLLICLLRKFLLLLFLINCKNEVIH